jgi:hypothetical protein
MRKIAVFTFGLLVLQAVPVPAQAAQDEVSQGRCWVVQPGEARSRLELTDIGDRIKVRFEVYRSPVGHSWHIMLRHAHAGIPPFHWHHARIFESTRVASESGDLVVQRSVVDQGFDAFRVKAADRQTGQVCKAEAIIGG